MRRRSPSALKWLALIIGAIFVLTGIAALAGDPGAAVRTTGRTNILVKSLDGLRDALGDPGGGIAMIVIGFLLGGVLYRAAGRKG